MTSFRFRRGTLTPGQRRNWENLWPTLGRDLLTSTGADGKVVEPPLDAAQWFGRTAPLILEVGSGTGISTAAMAADEPQFDVIAVEVYQPGLAQLVGLVDRGGLTNVRMIRGDAVVVLDELIAPKSLLGIRVFFPDPWPKARHHKRRLLQSGTLATMAEKLVDDGVLHIATDHADYTEWIHELLATQDTSRTHLVPLSGAEPGAASDPLADAGASPISLARPTTKFEGRAADEGRVVTEFVYTRAEGQR